MAYTFPLGFFVTTARRTLPIISMAAIRTSSLRLKGNFGVFIIEASCNKDCTHIIARKKDMSIFDDLIIRDPKNNVKPAEILYFTLFQKPQNGVA